MKGFLLLLGLCSTVLTVLTVHSHQSIDFDEALDEALVAFSDGKNVLERMYVVLPQINATIGQYAKNFGKEAPPTIRDCMVDVYALVESFRVSLTIELCVTKHTVARLLMEQISFGLKITLKQINYLFKQLEHISTTANKRIPKTLESFAELREKFAKRQLNDLTRHAADEKTREKVETLLSNYSNAFKAKLEKAAEDEKKKISSYQDSVEDFIVKAKKDGPKVFENIAKKLRNADLSIANGDSLLEAIVSYTSFIAKVVKKGIELVNISFERTPAVKELLTEYKNKREDLVKQVQTLIQKETVLLE